VYKTNDIVGQILTLTKVFSPNVILHKNLNRENNEQIEGRQAEREKKRERK